MVGMEEVRPKVNVADLVLGFVLFAAIPLLTYGIISQSGSSQSGAEKKVPPLSYDELREMRGEYERMYKENGQLFLRRMGDAKYQDQEKAWARAVLERCKKGFTEIQDLLKARPTAGMEGYAGEIKNWILTIESSLKSIPPGTRKTAAPPPKPPEESASPGG